MLNKEDVSVGTKHVNIYKSTMHSYTIDIIAIAFDELKISLLNH